MGRTDILWWLKVLNHKHECDTHASGKVHVRVHLISYNYLYGGVRNSAKSKCENAEKGERNCCRVAWIKGLWEKTSSECEAHPWKAWEVAVGIEVVINLNSRRYRAKVVDLLEWTPPQKKRPAKTKETTQQGSKQVSCFLKIRRLST